MHGKDREEGGAGAKSGDLHSSPLAARIWPSVVNGEAQTIHIYVSMSVQMFKSRTVFWAVKTQSMRHTANWIRPSSHLPPLVYITVH